MIFVEFNAQFKTFIMELNSKEFPQALVECCAGSTSRTAWTTHKH